MMDNAKLQHMARRNTLPLRFILCPIFESTAYLCDRKVEYFIAGTALCEIHGKRFGLTIAKLTANLKEPADA